ncbi:MAG: phage holin family protein [Balneolales bacterium]
MKTTDDPTLTERLKKLPVEIKLLVEKRAELLALNVSDMVTSTITKMIYKIAGGLIMFIGLIFLLHTLSLFIGQLLENIVLGYLIVSAVIILIGLVIFSLNPNKMVKKTKQKMKEPFDDAIKSSFSSNTKANDSTHKPD